MGTGPWGGTALYCRMCVFVLIDFTPALSGHVQGHRPCNHRPCNHRHCNPQILQLMDPVTHGPCNSHTFLHTDLTTHRPCADGTAQPWDRAASTHSSQPQGAGGARGDPHAAPGNPHNKQTPGRHQGCCGCGGYQPQQIWGWKIFISVAWQLLPLLWGGKGQTGHGDSDSLSIAVTQRGKTQ